MKKQLLTIALLFGTNVTTLAEKIKFSLNNDSDGITFFTVYNSNNQLFTCSIGPRGSHTSQNDSPITHVTVAYASRERMQELRHQNDNGKQMRGQKLAAFIRPEGVKSGAFTFTEKNGLTFSKM